MIGRIARKELTEHLRDGRFRAAAIIVGVLLIGVLIAGWRTNADIAAQHAAASAATRTAWLQQPAKNPHSAAHYGVYAFKPRTALTSFDTGVDPYVGVAAWLEAHKQNEFKYAPAADRTAVQRFGDLTGAFVLQTLIPLVVILLTFGAFAGEREQGTLRQVLSLGVRPATLWRGKALGTALAMSFILVPAAIVAALVIVLAGGAAAEDGLTVARGVGIALVYLAWCAIWVGASLAVSAQASSSRAALVTLIALWMITVVVAPRVAADVSAAWYPTPSAQAFQRALDKDLADTAAVKPVLEARRRALFAQYGVTREEDLPINFAGVSLQAGEEHGNDVFDKHYGALYDQFARQNRTQDVFGLLAPATVVRSLSMALAGTDVSHHRAFATAAESYRRDMQRVLNADIVANQKPGQVYLAGAEVWARVPPFTYSLPSLGWVWRTHAIAVAIIGLWVVVAGALAAGAISRARIA